MSEVPLYAERHTKDGSGLGERGEVWELPGDDGRTSHGVVLGEWGGRGV